MYHICITGSDAAKRSFPAQQVPAESNRIGRNRGSGKYERVLHWNSVPIEAV